MKVKIELGDINRECFVLMPFTTEFDLIYEHVLRPAIEEVDLVPNRADQIYGSRRIMRDVWNKIRTARIVIAELTGRNANVLYELGMAHAIGKPFIIITNSMDDVPFDLKDLRCIVYNKDHPKWGDSLKNNVARTMKAVLNEIDEHGPLFTEIETEPPYAPVEAKALDDSTGTQEQAEEVLNIAGEWILNEIWQDAEDHQTRWTIEQNGNLITGFAISTPEQKPETKTWEVIQEISGFTRGKRVEISATSYQILETGEGIMAWTLDSWRGVVEDGNTIRGEVVDEKGRTGKFSGEKITTE